MLYAKIAVHLRTVVDPRPMALYRQHGGSACQVAIEAGEWQRTGPSAPEQRYLEWMRAYVLDATGGDPETMAVVERNLEHAARGQHVSRSPEPAPAGLRRHVPAPARRALRVMRRRMRRTISPPSVIGVWSEQFLAPTAALPSGPTLVVEAESGDEPWVAQPPREAFAGAVAQQPWTSVESSTATYERIVVPYGASAAVTTTALMAGLGRLLPPHGSAVALIPGPASDNFRPDADAIIDLARQALPHHRTVVEAFGNEATVRAVASGAAAATLGTLVDRHDPAVPVVYGLMITPGCAPGTPSGSAA